MKSLSKTFSDDNNQVVFLTLGLFWVTNIGIFLESSLFSRLFIYPVFFIIHLIFSYLLFTISKYKNNMDAAAFWMLWILVLLGIIYAARGIINQRGIDDIRSLLFGSVISTLTWLLPLTVLYGLKKEFWFTWLPRVRIIVAIGLFFVILFMLLGISSKDITGYKMYNSADFLFISAFLFIFSIYKPNRINIFIGCMGMIVLIAHMFLHDERFAIAYIILMALFYILAIATQQYRIDLKVYVFFIGTIILLSIVFIGLNVTAFQEQIVRYFFQGEMWVDTRGGGSLQEAVTQGMSTRELIFGKGPFGKYVWGYRGWPPVLYIRSSVEIGYMQIILKGGYAMLISFLLISIYAAYLGLFRSKNKITRYLAIIIIARLIIMLTAMYPCLGFEYFMYWIAVGGCLSTQLRAIDDNILKTKCELGRRLVLKW